MTSEAIDDPAIDPSTRDSKAPGDFAEPGPFAMALPHLLLAGFLFMLLCPIFRPGALIADAHPSRLAEVYSQFHRAFGQQGWFAGWDQRLQAGLPVGTYQYQLSYLLICLLGVLGFPLHIGYKLIFFGGMVFSACMIHGLMRRSDPLRDRIGGCVALGVAIAFFVSTSAVSQMAQGFWNHVMALGILAVFIGRLNKVEILGAREALPLMLLYALIALAHEYTAVATGVFMLGWLPGLWKRGGARSVLWWCAIPTMAVLLVAPYSLPLALTHHYMVSMESTGPSLASFLDVALPVAGLTGLNPLTPMPASERLITLASEAPSFVAWLLALTLAPHWRAGRLSASERRLGVGLLIALILFATINLRLLQWTPVEAVRRAVGQIVPGRFLQYTHLIVYLLAAMALRHWLRPSGRLPLLVRRLAVALLLALLGVVALKNIYSLNANHRLDTLATLPQRDDLLATWNWLQVHDDGRHRVLFETPYDNFPWGKAGEGQALRQSTIMALAPIETGVRSAGELLNLVLPMHERTRTANGRIMNIKLESATPELVNPLLDAGNFGRIVACSPKMIDWLGLHPGMRRAAEFGPFVIFEYPAAPGRWAEAKGGEPVDFKFDPENDARMRAGLNNLHPNNQLTIRVAWHPYWSATAGGKSLRVEPDDYGNLVVDLPDTGSQTVELSYSARLAWTLLVALAAWLGLALAWQFTRQSAARSAA